MEFTFKTDTKIYFGTDIVEEALQQEADRLFDKNIMIVTTGRSLINYGYLQQLEQIVKKLSQSGKVIIYDCISRNPRLSEVKQASTIGRENAVQTVIGFGGGSAIDAAKATAAGITQIDLLEEYLLNGREPSDKTLPVIAIPTTAGTGSELSRAAILSSEKDHIKSGIRGNSMVPKVAVVDAKYTWTVPRKITVETGFDVLAHAIESYTAVKSNSFSEMLSEKAIKIVGKNIPLLIDDIENHEARKEMCFASMLMGMNLANVGTALPHRLQYPIGALTDTSHSAGLIALYPAWIQHEYEVNQCKIEKVIQWLGMEKPANAKQIYSQIESLKERWKIPYTLQTLGIQEEMLEQLVNQVTGNLGNDKLAEKSNIVEMIYKESL